MASSLADTTKNAMLDTLATTVTHMSLHTADPSTTGANEVSGGSYARQAVTWASAAAGSKAITGTITWSVPASTTVAYVGMWSASTAGTWRGTFDTVDEVFAGAGQYQLTSATISL